MRKHGVIAAWWQWPLLFETHHHLYHLVCLILPFNNYFGVFPVPKRFEVLDDCLSSLLLVFVCWLYVYMYAYFLVKYLLDDFLFFSIRLASLWVIESLIQWLLVQCLREVMDCCGLVEPSRVPLWHQTLKLLSSFLGWFHHFVVIWGLRQVLEARRDVSLLVWRRPFLLLPEHVLLRGWLYRRRSQIKWSTSTRGSRGHWQPLLRERKLIFEVSHFDPSFLIV